jgi:putative nucleotidyltransferase with HDIG domain
MSVGIVLLALLEYRTARTFLLTRRKRDLSLAVGIVWLGCALAGLLLLGYMDLGFWIAHVLEVGGVALVGLPTAFDLRSSSRMHPLVGDLAAIRLVSEEEAFLGPRVRSLMLRLAEKDGSTETHTRRVSLLAMRVGEQLGLSPARLRTLAVGGLLHDIGKLTVPDSILKKPGSLDDEEFAVIRRHPAWGDELLAELGGFPAAVRRLVRDHHERLDGNGYPSGLDAGDLSLETRILTVCDVYDALVSERVYREAWTHERAMGLLRGDIDKAFDGLCVDALEDVVADESGLAAAA